MRDLRLRPWLQRLVALPVSGLLLSSALSFLLPAPVSAQAPLRKIGELELAVRGLSATVEPTNPVVPRNVASAVRVVVRAGAFELTGTEAAEFFGADFAVQGELSGPGLTTTLSLPQGGKPDAEDPFLLHFPPLPTVGHYSLANLRVVAGGRTVLDAAPSRVTVNVIDRVLVTSVKTRPLSLDEIVARGIDLADAENYLGFGFTLGLKLESEAVQFSFPVIFNREGAVVPEPLQPPPAPPRVTGSVQRPRMPTIVPLLLEAAGDSPDSPPLTLELPSGEPVRIPGLLVIPGDVGYLKQFFSAQLIVANGAPAGSGLVVTNVQGTIELPPGEDQVVGPGPGGTPSDDPLSLPDLIRDGETQPQPGTLPVRGVGLDEVAGTEDDLDVFAPGEQGLADFTIRGEAEGFHPISFDIRADLDGLPVGRVKLKGRADGGVLVRNPSFDLTFTAPSVVRTDEKFSLFVTVTNVGQSAANKLTVSIDTEALSGAAPEPPGSPTVRSADELQPGDSKTFEYEFVSQRTGQVVASYLRFDADDDVSGSLKFKLAVGERGVPLSPDTLVLPSSVAAVPDAVVRAAMRVLGQAWSVANAPSLPADVVRTDRSVVQKKALALAEAGLRTTLGQDPLDAVRDLAWDLYAGEPEPDPGFDQLLRTTEAGRGLGLALGAALGEPALGGAEGPLGYEREWAQLLASGPDFLTFAVAAGGAAAPVDVVLRDDADRRTVSVVPSAVIPRAEVPGAVLLPLGGPEPAPLLGLVTAPTSPSYFLEIYAREAGPVDVAVTLPRGDGTVFRGTASVTLPAGGAARLAVDLARPGRLVLEHDMDGFGAFHARVPVVEDAAVRYPEGPALVSARVIGPETLDGASPFGVYAALLFDRVVDDATAADPDRYTVPDNEVRAARRQLSGRLVFASLAQPEGPYVPTTMTVDGLADARGMFRMGSTTVQLDSLLEEPGAIVTGRVITAEGEPVPGIAITYVNTTGYIGVPCLNAIPTGLSQQDLEDGSFELRYVRQSPCGPFKIVTQDPATGARREVTGRVRTAGQRIVLDIALIARGTVTGTVRRFASVGSLETVPAAAVPVVAYSATDTQSGGSGVTDGDGRYVIDGVTVGPVNVRAGGEYGVGIGAGSIERPGTPAVVDILLDGDAARIHGTVRMYQDGKPGPVPGVQVLYYFKKNQLLDAVYTDDAGEYAFEGVPAGEFKVTAALNTRDQGKAEGYAGAGQDVSADIVIEVPDPETLGTVRGLVVHPDGATGVPGAIVNVGSFGAVTVSEDDPRYPARPVGFFEILEVPFTPYKLEWARAATPDGRQSGSRQFSFPEGSTEVDAGTIVLSGLGEAHFLVEDHEGNRLGNQLVMLQGSCRNPCGCASASTGPTGAAAVFRNLPVGTVSARAFRSGGGAMDVATGSATIKANGEIGVGTLVFPGTGTVTVQALEPGGAIPEVHGAEVTLRSNLYVNDGLLLCGLQKTESHGGRTDEKGRITFTGVNAGPVSVSVHHPFFDRYAGKSGTLAGGGEIAFAVEFTENLAGELSGTVFLPDGETPAGPGVEVTLTGPLPDISVRTNAESRYRFAKILPPGTWTLTAFDSETAGVARSKVALQTGQDLSHDVRLKGRGTVRVRVVDGADEPVGQATVRLSETEYPNNTYDGILGPSSQGVVTFQGVYEGPVSAEASDAFGRDGGGREPGVLPGPGATVELTVTLTTTGTVTGVFRMPSPDTGPGTPIPFGAITLKSDNNVIGQTTGDDGGRFTFDYVPAGQIRLDALDPLTGRTGFATGSIDDEGELLELDVVAQALRTVTGTVTSNGVPEPLPALKVVSGSYRVETAGDADGVYRVDGVPAGQVEVTASRVGGLLKGSNKATFTEEGPPLEIDVELRDTGRVEGVVVEAGGGAPAPLSRVTVTVGGWGGGRQETFTDEVTGAFVLAEVPSGSATLDVDVVGSLDRAQATVVVPPRGVLEDLTVELNGVGSIRGQTVGVPDGFSQKVTLRNEGGFAWHHVLIPDTEGGFGVSRVLAGEFSAHLEAARGPERLYGIYKGEVRPGEETDFLLELEPTGRLEGTVFRSDGAPAHGARVKVKTPKGTLPDRQVREDGSFALDGVRAGPVTVDVDDPFSGGVGRGEGTVPEDGVLVVARIDLDDDPVAVESVAPPDGSAGVALDEPITLTFSDPVTYATSSNVFVADESRQWSQPPQVAPDGLSLTLWPAGAGWPDSRVLTVNVTTAITDRYGRHPVQPFTSRFETVDLSPPYVAAVVPVDGGIEVGEGARVTVTFDEPLAATLDPSGLVVLAPSGGTPLAGVATLSLDRREVGFTPAAPLFWNTLYAITVNGAEDESGNRQTSPFVSSFVTIDTVPPVLTATAPVAGSWSANPRPPIRVDIVDPGAGSGLNLASAILSLDGAAVAPSTNSTGITFTPETELAEGPHVLAATIADRAGNVGELSTPLTFGVDATPPGSASITSPMEGQTLRGAVTLTAVAADAVSGVAEIRVFLDGAASPFATLAAPDFAATWDTSSVADGWRSLTARAVDLAGNVGPAAAAVGALVDNDELTVQIVEPAPGTPFREVVTARAQTSEPATRVDFSAGGSAATGTPLADRTYEATLDLSSAPEGDVELAAAAFGLLGEETVAAINIVVDRTPPPPPNPGLITARESDAGYAQVHGVPGAVEANVSVEVTNPDRDDVVVVAAAADGSFAGRLFALLDDELSIVAIDEVGNRSGATLVVVDQATHEDGIPLDGLSLWVSADQGVTTDSLGRAEHWADRSEEENDLRQTLEDARPELIPDGFNGWPVLRFDGDDVVEFTTPLTTIRTVFWVVRSAETGDMRSQRRSLLGHGDSYDLYGGYGAPGPIWDAGAAASVREGQTWVNGVPVNGRTEPRPTEMSVVSLVATGDVRASLFGDTRWSESWLGDLAELIVYERPLTPAERQSVEDHLVRKYRPYAPAAGTPAILPAGGTFEGSTTVQLATTTPGADIRFTLDGTEPTTTSELYTGALVIDETTTVRARAFLAGYLESATATVTFIRGDTSPVLRPGGLLLWLRADAGISTDAGDWVMEWLDQSGNDNHVSQRNGVLSPQVIAGGASGLPMIRFDGVDDVVELTTPLTTIRTVFWVVRSAETGDMGSQRRSLLGHGDSYDLHGGYGAPGPIWDASAAASVREGQTWVNGVPVNGRTEPRPTEMSVVSLVATGDVRASLFGDTRWSESWLGDLAELIIYDRELSALERRRIEDHLLARYTLSENLRRPEISPPGGVFAETQDVTMATQSPGATIHYTLDGSEPTIDSPGYTEPLSIESTVTLKAKTFGMTLEPSPTATASFTKRVDAVPLDVLGIQLWWRADAGVPSGAGDFWEDQSGQGNHGHQTDGRLVAGQVTDAVSGLPAMRFDGVDDVVELTTPLTTIRTVFWVVRSAETGDMGSQRRSLLGHGDSYDLHGGYGAPGPIWDASAAASVREGQTWVNGVPVNGRTEPRPTEMSVVSLVATGDVRASLFGDTRWSESWLGDLAELIIYDRELSALERRRIEDHLLARYTLSENLRRPEISPPGGVFAETQDVTMATQSPGATIHYTLDGSEPTIDSPGYTEPLSIESTVTLKAKTFGMTLEPSPTATASFTKRVDAVPLDVLGIQLWWRADAGVPSGAGDFWEDQSGQGNHGHQTDGRLVAGQVTDAVSGLPAMRFDGVDDVVELTTPLTTIRTVFWVVRSAETGDMGSQRRSLLGHGDSYDLHGGYGAPGPIWDASAAASVREGQTWVNGVPVNGRTEPRPTEMSVVSLVATGDVRASLFGDTRWSESWLGDLAELIIYDRALTEDEVRQVEDYLNGRYQLFIRVP